MKLTNNDRAAFVRAVMLDVPKVDHAEQARKLVTDAATAKLPKAVKALWDDPKTREFVACNTYCSMPGSLGTTRTPPVAFTMPKKLEELAELANAQRISHEELRNKVRALIGGCSTIKQAADRLPEFTKYLPASRDGVITGNLPAVANVVTELVQAGWPTGTKPTVKK